jgi:hypothetical protein
MNDVVRELRRQQALATEAGAPERAALLHLLVVIEELGDTVGELHERVTRLERRAAAERRTA